jgi:hypothetical protein
MHGYISARVVRPAGRGAEVVGRFRLLRLPPLTPILLKASTLVLVHGVDFEGTVSDAGAFCSAIEADSFRRTYTRFLSHGRT